MIDLIIKIHYFFNVKTIPSYLVISLLGIYLQSLPLKITENADTELYT